MKKTYFLISVLVLFLSISPALSETDRKEISVVVGANAGCGTHSGGFEAKYLNKKIEVYFGHSPNKVNPIPHPIKVYDNKRIIEDWWGILCPEFPRRPPYNISLTGKKVDLYGRWKDEKTFEAYTLTFYTTQDKTEVPTPFEDYGACPFECCTYREWIANKDTVIQKDQVKKSPIFFTVRKGDKVIGLTGIVITTKPGRAKVLRPIMIGEIEAQIGDIVYILTYQGEGSYKTWFQGKIIDGVFIDGMAPFSGGWISPKNPRTFKVIEPPERIWWVKIKNGKGQIGWSDQPGNFDNKDSCK